MKYSIQDTLKNEMLDNAPVAMAFYDLHNNIQWANKEYQKVVKLPLDEIKKRKCYSIFGLSAPCTVCPVTIAVNTEEPAEGELRTGKQNEGEETGSIWWTKSAPIKDGHDNIVGTIVAVFEITDRRAAELALKRSEERLREAQHLTHIGSWEFDVQGNVLYLSDEIYRIFEIDPSDFAGTYEAFLNAVHPDDRELVNSAYRESLQKKTPYGMEHRLLLKDGRIKFVYERCETCFDNQGRAVRSIGTVQDITERKMKEEENRKLQAQYHHAQKMESIGRLAGGVAHDFNNMLSVILGNVDLALEQMDTTHRLYSQLMEIQHAAQRSAKLTQQLLGFARRQPYRPKTININNTISEMLKILQRLIGEDIDLAWIPGPEVGFVKMDPAQVEQIMANLCVNARDAISGVGKITIETQDAFFDDAYCSENPGFLPGAYVMLAVSDNGSGIDKEIQNQIFEPFFSTKKSDKGTGLGLATVYGIVKQNKGFINVYSEKDNGTTIKIYFSHHKTNDEVSPIEPARRLKSKGNGELILLVEDDAMVLSIMKKMLELSGYQVLTANCPSKALRLVKELSVPVDLLITDVVMPEMNGKDLAEKITKIYPNIKTLFLSAYTANVIAHHGVLQDGVAFLQKPVSREDLAEKVHSVMYGRAYLNS